MTQAQIHEIEERLLDESQRNYKISREQQQAYYAGALPYALKLAESEQTCEALRLTIAEMTVELSEAKALLKGLLTCIEDEGQILEFSDEHEKIENYLKPKTT